MTWVDETIRRRAAASPSFAAAYELEAEQLQLAVALADMRREQGLTQRQLAELSGKPQSTIARIENGSMNASLKLLIEIAASVGRRVQVRFIAA
ncbi:MAG: helix-turn-helix domain-containing protein [Propionibacteriaceae bacterium]|jgi:DNA-binding XRE family transcriptional regulator|nr:helix-turn-helix domain-containing protein [Propionibacteriaceae bacterium]